METPEDLQLIDEDVTPSSGEKQKTSSTKPPSSKTSTKRKIVSFSQFDELKSTVSGMQTEVSNLLTLFRETLGPASKRICLQKSSEERSTPAVTDVSTATQSISPMRLNRMYETDGNEFPIQGGNDLPTANNGNQFSTVDDNFQGLYDGNQFPNVSGDQFSAHTNAPSASNLLTVDLPPDLQRSTSFNCAASVLSGASNEGQFVPSFENPEITLPEIPAQSTTTTSSDCAKITFQGDQPVGPKISDSYATFVEDCARKRILTTELTQLKAKLKRPENCPALSVPTIHPHLWANLPKEAREHDKRFQNAQELLTKGLIGVVQVKELILQFNTHPDQFPKLFKELNEKLDDSVALLGNAFLESSYRRRDMLKPAIHPRYHSLCGPKTQVTKYLFGDNVLESAKTLQSSQKLTRSMAPGRNTSQVSRQFSVRPQTQPQRQFHAQNRLNYRGHFNNTWRARTAQNSNRPQPQNSQFRPAFKKAPQQ